MPDWQSLLSKKAEDAVAPQPLPVGTYLLQIESHRFDESSKKKTPFVEFSFKILDVGPDVDRAQLAAVDVSKMSPTAEFYLTDRSDFMLREFLEKLGLPVGGGRTFGDLIPETQGRTVKCYFRHEPIEGRDGFRARPSKWLAADEG